MQDKPVTLAAISGAHGVTGEVRLKLFGEVMLENRGHPLFAEFMPQFGDFMKKLKKGIPTEG